MRPEPALAQHLVGKTTGLVQEKLQEVGVDSKEIETKNYHINATHDWVDDTRVFKGYTATNILEVKTAKLELVSKILEAAVTGGAQEISYVNFEYQDEDGLQCQALRKAAENARMRAQAMAETLGVKLGSVLRLTDAAERSGRYYYAAAEAMPCVAEANTDYLVVEPDEIEASASIEAVFELIVDSNGKGTV